MRWRVARGDATPRACRMARDICIRICKQRFSMCSRLLVLAETKIKRRRADSRYPASASSPSLDGDVSFIIQIVNSLNDVDYLTLIPDLATFIFQDTLCQVNITSSSTASDHMRGQTNHVSPSTPGDCRASAEPVGHRSMPAACRSSTVQPHHLRWIRRLTVNFHR